MAEQPTVGTDNLDVTRLRRRFEGQVLLPDDDGYHQARRVWNAIVDRRPAVIARCASPSDVAAAVRFAAARDLKPFNAVLHGDWMIARKFLDPSGSGRAFKRAYVPKYCVARLRTLQSFRHCRIASGKQREESLRE